MTEAPVTSAPCCGNCRYSVMETTEQDHSVGPNWSNLQRSTTLVGRGTCHRYAPKAELCYDTRPKDTVGNYWVYWPSISSADWCGEWESHAPDLAPPVSLQDVRALADFMAQSGATPLFDGFDGPPAPPRSEAPPATTEPEFPTYDKFEDPLL